MSKVKDKEELHGNEYPPFFGHINNRSLNPSVGEIVFFDQWVQLQHADYMKSMKGVRVVCWVKLAKPANDYRDIVIHLPFRVPAKYLTVAVSELETFGSDSTTGMCSFDSITVYGN